MRHREYPKIIDLLLVLLVFPVMASGTAIFLVNAFCQFCHGDGELTAMIPIAIALWAIDVGILAVWRTRQDL